MKNIFIILLFCVQWLVPPARALPLFVVKSDKAEVHGSPRSDSILLDTLDKGETVRIHCLGKGYGLNWAMIQPAQWVKMSDLERVTYDKNLSFD